VLELGQGAADITPKIGAIMDGFAARPGPARRILDRLSVRALCFRSNGGGFHCWLRLDRPCGGPAP